MLEIALRTVILFSYAVLLFRLGGARTLSQLSLAEVVLIIGLGAAVGDPMLYANVPILHGMVVITLVVGLQRLLTRLSARSVAIQHLLEARAIRLVRDGVIEEEGLRAACLSHEELFGELRQKGAENLADVKRAYMEADGNFSVFRYAETQAHTSDYDLLDDADRTMFVWKSGPKRSFHHAD